jgi:uncharacterized membrane protein
VNLDSFHSLISVGASILVDAPVERVYEQWKRVEEFPKFMNAVREVRRIDGDRFYWRVERGSREYESIQQIVLQIPERRIAWRTISGAESAGVVGFDPLPGRQTLVSFKMKYSPDAGWSNSAALLARVRKRLENFKAFIESLSETEDAPLGTKKQPRLETKPTRAEREGKRT